MKDVAILTKFYKNYNYGGMLQGYALYKLITKLGYSVDIISYDVTKNENPVYPNIYLQSKQYGIKAAVSKISEKAVGKGKFLIRDLLSCRTDKFTQFMMDTYANTEVYTDDTIKFLKQRYKTFVSGSDQIWNPNAVRNLYLQTFNASSKRKISYAASIGRDSFSKFEAEVMIPAIKQFGSISVREKTAKELLEMYIDRPISTVLDPTMLLSVEEWESISAERVIQERYALVYFFSNSLKVRYAAEKFCEKHGLQLVMIPYAKQEYNLTDHKGPGKRYEYAGPYEFISLIRNADFVLTDSFHGAVFSIIFQIPFAVFERNKAGHVSMNSRLYDLLDTFNEGHRLIDIDHIGKLDMLLTINEEKISSILSEKKEESINYLKSAIDKGITEYDHVESVITVTGEEATCSGCGACIEICPENCICFTTNNNGFNVPLINKDICIGCGKCLKICPMTGGLDAHEPLSVFAAFTKMPEKKSASGGISYCTAKKFILDGGIVYGAAYVDNLRVRLMRSESLDNLERLQGSKYVQADMKDIIQKVICDLQRGKKVLFAGTPCEIAGVKAVAIAKKVDKELYTSEIICHGVPSPKMFEDYIKWAEEHYRKKITSYSFRVKDKDNDKDFMLQITFSDGSKCRVSGFKDPYYKLFMSSRWFRESCYECPFAAKKRIADVTMGDFWNSEKLPDNFGKKRRISVVLLNTEKGFKLFDSIKEEIDLSKSTWEIAASGNTNLYRATRKFAGYKGYGEIGPKLFKMESESSLNIKKYVFNQLPYGFKRGIKKVVKNRG